MSEKILIIKNLNKTYRYHGVEVQALRDFNLEVTKGEIICLFGRSGSGKTTLLNLIGCLDIPDSGEIFIAGQNTAEIPPDKMPVFRRKNIGFVFQHFNLIPYLTALENTELPLKFEKIPVSRRRDRARDRLQELGLAGRLDFTLPYMSGGEIQRTAFARATIMDPAIVLADEPTGQLDSTTSTQLSRMIVDMNEQGNNAFLIATHDPVLASIAHRIIYIEDGQKVAEEEDRR